MIGLVHCECFLPECYSLKEKRSILQSLITRARRLNISISGMDHQDVWQRTTLAIACINNSRKVIEKELDHVLKLIDHSEGIECHSVQYEWL
ncbi:DUF503 domain-containing protein [Natribacillus halophilus]|uniref:YlxP-like protein n=1 Tax=Natribacillus halophilus TaxID=549003 RepID=A0A1G8PQ65_9BACI|nr:DUF503 domain-containing protein [Natribacillus halophilus]SDI94661.1 hypothetical protein SAMN04488123_10955 [Natribacillus halophilus]